MALGLHDLLLQTSYLRRFGNRSCFWNNRVLVKGKEKKYQSLRQTDVRLNFIFLYLTPIVGCTHACPASLWNAKKPISSSTECNMIDIFHKWSTNNYVFFPLSPLLSSPFVQPVREKKGSMHAKRKCLKIVVYNTGTSRCIQMPFARRSVRDVDRSDRLEKGNTYASARGSAANYAPVWSKCNRSDTGVCPAEGIKKCQCAFFFLLSRSSNTCNDLNFS